MIPTIGVTIVVNVPMNNALAAVAPTDPQAANSSDAKKPWKKLVIDGADNWSGYLVERQNFAGAEGSATAGQFVNVSSVTISNGVVMRSSTGADGVWISQHAVNVTKHVPLVALA